MYRTTDMVSMSKEQGSLVFTKLVVHIQEMFLF